MIIFKREIVKGQNRSTADHLFERQLMARQVIEFGRRFTWSNTVEIEFHTRSNLPYCKFDFLINDLKQWESKKFGLFLFAENPCLPERIHSIFEDLKVEINFLLPLFLSMKIL